MSTSSGDTPLHFSHTCDGTCVHYRGRALYNPRSPRSAAERRAGALQIEPDTLYIVASPLLGYGLDTLSKSIPDSSTAIAVEFDPELSTVTRTEGEHSIRVLNDKFSVTEVSRTISQIIDRNIKRARLVTLSGGYRFAPEQYNDLLRLLTDEISLRWRNAATRIHFGRKWMRNLFRNASLPWSADTRSYDGYPFTDYRPGINHPVVVCGAGESLEWNIDTIRAHRNRVYVFAVDTALGTLREGGVEPDAVLALESQVVNVGDFLPGLPPECLLYYDLTSHPSVPELVPPYRRRPFLTRFADLSIIDRAARSLPLVATIPPFSSVGITAVHMACGLTKHPVVLAGLDFAYVLGKPHARGTLSHRLSLATDACLRSPLLYDHSVFRPRIRRVAEAGTPKSPESDSDELQSRAAGPYETEAVLFQQVTLLSQAVKTGSSVYSLARRGPPIRIPEISRSRFEALLDQAPDNLQDRADLGESLGTYLTDGRRVSDSRGSSGGGGAEIPSPSHSDFGGKRSIESEGEAVRRFLTEEYRRLDELLTHGRIEGMEYLFFDFPDRAASTLAESAIKTGNRLSLYSLEANLARKIRLRAESYHRYLARLPNFSL